MRERVKIKESPDFLMIKIRANFSRFDKFNYSVLFFGWTIGIFITLANILKGSFESLFLFPFVILIEIYLLLSWLWGVYGKEEIAINSKYFIVTRGFFKYGPSLILCNKDIASIEKTNFYKGIKFWQILSSFWENGGIQIVSKDGKKYSFGLMLKLEDKELIYERINSYFIFGKPQQEKKI